MSLFEKFVDCFNNYDPDVFRELHHEEFMVVQEMALLDRDQHCETINELATKPEWDWHKKAELIHENHYCVEMRWIDGDEIVTNVALKKDGKSWRSVVSRLPRQKAA